MLLLFSSGAAAQDGKSIEKLAFGESDEKVEAIAALVASGTPKAAEILQALADGELNTSGKRVLIVRGDSAVDAVTGEKLAAVPEDKEDIIANNRLRRELAGAIAALRLVSPKVEERFAAAKELLGNVEPGMLPLVKKALGAEQNAQVKAMLEQIAAALELKSEDRALRLAAVQKLGASNSPSAKTLLIGFLKDEKEIYELFMVVDEELKMMCDICNEGGQVLGPTFDYTHRLIDFSLMAQGAIEEPATAPPSGAPSPRVASLLSDEGLIEKPAAPADDDPARCRRFC